MITKAALRNEYGKGYFTAIGNDLVAWKPLSTEDYYYYQALTEDSEMVMSVLEDEIFLKCVTDKNYTNNIKTLSAGIISTVVQNIMEHSGPATIEHFNTYLDHKRVEAQQPVHTMVTLIVRAFPAYKPEDIYAMPFETFMLRLAQAESLLTMLGIIKEPIKLTDGNEEPLPPTKKHVPPELRAIWEKQQQQKKPSPQKPGTNKPGKGVKFDKVDMSPEKSPIFNKDKTNPQYRNLGDLNIDRIQQEQAVGSEEESAARAQMVKEAQALYSSTIAKMNFYKKK